MNATVTFTCTPGGLPITSCSSPQTVSTEGAGQIVSGAVFDTAGDSATVGVTVNLDKTIPTLTVTSPVDGTSETASPVSVSGTLSDSLSGTSGVTCDGVAATLSGGSFSCTVSLGVGNNLVTVRGTDIAGNVAGDNFHLSLTGSLPAPNSLQVTPTGVNMVVGGTQQFTAVDDQGRPRSDASWTVDNTSVATIDTNSSPTLTAVATGTATLTATVGSVTAQTQVNVLSGTSLPLGTVLWSAPTRSGYSALQTLQAVPVIGLPDLYSVQRDAATASALVSAFTADGRMLWSSSSFTGSVVYGVPDGNGGTLLLVNPTSGNQSSLVDLDGPTGAVVWRYNSPGQMFPPSSQGHPIAVGPDGSTYFTETTYTGSLKTGVALVALDAASGTVKARYNVPFGTDLIQQDGTCGYTGPPQTFTDTGTLLTDPVVGPDGTVMTGQDVLSTTTTYGCTVKHTTDERLSLLTIAPDGSASPSLVYDDTTLHPHQTAGSGIDAVIPDGSGGALVTWEYDDPPAGSQQAFHVTDMSNSGITDSLLPGLLSGATQVVLGDSSSGLAYASDRLSVVAFNISGGSPVWTYTPASNDSTNIIAALTANKPLSGNKLSIVSTTGQAPITQTLLVLDNAGTVTSSGVTGTISSPLPDPNLWLGISNNSLAEFVGPTDSLASSTFPLVQGNLQGQSKSPSCQTPTSTCTIAPTTDTHTTGSFPERDITYGVFLLQSSDLTRSLHHKIGLLEELLSGGSINCLAGDPHTSCDGTDQLTDALAAQFTTGSTVRQKLFVDRVQVKVYWPYPGAQTQWFGAYSQQATTSNSYTSGAHITQESRDSGGVLCASGCSKIATDGTTTLP